MKDLKVAVLIPCYKRPEYTQKCMKALYGADSIKPDLYTISRDSLRDAIIEFFDKTRGKYDFLAKIDNDCIVPKHWISDMVDAFDDDVDILSPNVMPSDAAHKHGKDIGKKYLGSNIIGGLWFMRSHLIDHMSFVNYDVKGIKGAIALLRQIVVENEAKLGWVPSVVVQDLGHWSGDHPEHIKSKDHEEYSKEVGREISWQA